MKKSKKIVVLLLVSVFLLEIALTPLYSMNSMGLEQSNEFSSSQKDNGNILPIVAQTAPLIIPNEYAFINQNVSSLVYFSSENYDYNEITSEFTIYSEKINYWPFGQTLFVEFNLDYLPSDYIVDSILFPHVRAYTETGKDLKYDMTINYKDGSKTTETYDNFYTYERIDGNMVESIRFNINRLFSSEKITLRFIAIMEIGRPHQSVQYNAPDYLQQPSCMDPFLSDTNGIGGYLILGENYQCPDITLLDYDGTFYHIDIYLIDPTGGDKFLGEKKIGMYAIFPEINPNGIIPTLNITPQFSFSLDDLIMGPEGIKANDYLKIRFEISESFSNFFKDSIAISQDYTSFEYTIVCINPKPTFNITIDQFPNITDFSDPINNNDTLIARAEDYVGSFNHYSEIEYCWYYALPNEDFQKFPIVEYSIEDSTNKIIEIVDSIEHVSLFHLDNWKKIALLDDSPLNDFPVPGTLIKCQALFNYPETNYIHRVNSSSIQLQNRAPKLDDNGFLTVNLNPSGNVGLYWNISNSISTELNDISSICEHIVDPDEYYSEQSKISYDLNWYLNDTQDSGLFNQTSIDVSSYHIDTRVRAELTPKEIYFSTLGNNYSTNTYSANGPKLNVYNTSIFLADSNSLADFTRNSSLRFIAYHEGENDYETYDTAEKIIRWYADDRLIKTESFETGMLFGIGEEIIYLPIDWYISYQWVPVFAGDRITAHFQIISDGYYSPTYIAKVNISGVYNPPIQKSETNFKFVVPNITSDYDFELNYEVIQANDIDERLNCYELFKEIEDSQNSLLFEVQWKINGKIVYNPYSIGTPWNQLTLSHFYYKADDIIHVEINSRWLLEGEFVNSGVVSFEVNVSNSAPNIESLSIGAEGSLDSNCTLSIQEIITNDPDDHDVNITSVKWYRSSNLYESIPETLLGTDLNLSGSLNRGDYIYAKVIVTDSQGLSSSEKISNTVFIGGVGIENLSVSISPERIYLDDNIEINVNFVNSNNYTVPVIHVFWYKNYIYQDSLVSTDKQFRIPNSLFSSGDVISAYVWVSEGYSISNIIQSEEIEIVPQLRAGPVDWGVFSRMNSISLAFLGLIVLITILAEYKINQNRTADRKQRTIQTSLVLGAIIALYTFLNAGIFDSWNEIIIQDIPLPQWVFASLVSFGAGLIIYGILSGSISIKDGIAQVTKFVEDTSFLTPDSNGKKGINAVKKSSLNGMLDTNSHVFHPKELLAQLRLEFISNPSIETMRINTTSTRRFPSSRRFWGKTPKARVYALLTGAVPVIKSSPENGDNLRIHRNYRSIILKITVSALILAIVALIVNQFVAANGVPAFLSPIATLSNSMIYWVISLFGGTIVCGILCLLLQRWTKLHLAWNRFYDRYLKTRLEKLNDRIGTNVNQGLESFGSKTGEYMNRNGTFNEALKGNFWGTIKNLLLSGVKGIYHIVKGGLDLVLKTIKGIWNLIFSLNKYGAGKTYVQDIGSAVKKTWKNTLGKKKTSNNSQGGTK